MDSTMLAMCLGLFSAVTLAAANLAVKMGSDILAARVLLSLSAAMLVLPVTFFVPAPDARTWGALLLGLPAHLLYQLCVVRALQRGELSLVFPVMRGVAPLLTALAAFLLLDEALHPLAIVGLVVASGAVIVFAAPPPGVVLRHHPDRASLAWCSATALFIALYSVADARGVRLASTPFTYIVWLFLLDPIAITLIAVVRRRWALASVLAAAWRYGAAAGILSVLSFGSALYAFSLMETAKVAALRETSVVFAALMGAKLLGEDLGRRRIMVAVALAAGLILLQFAK